MLTRLTEFLDQCTDNIAASSAADIMEYLCVIDNSFLTSGSSNERVLVELSEDLLWWNVVRKLLEHLTDMAALSPVSLSRLIVCMLNLLAVVAGSRDILLIDRACLDESHYLSVYEQQTEGALSESGSGGCRVTSRLLEYCLIDMPLICISRRDSTRFSSQTIFKIVDTLLSACHRIDYSHLCDVLVHGKCQEIVGVTWLHPVVMWSLRQKIFVHCYQELLSAEQDPSTNYKISSLCSELKAVADAVDQSAAKLSELQKNTQHQFERNLFIIGHQLGGYEGEYYIAVSFLHACCT